MCLGGCLRLLSSPRLQARKIPCYQGLPPRGFSQGCNQRFTFPQKSAKRFIRWRLSPKEVATEVLISPRKLAAELLCPIESLQPRKFFVHLLLRSSDVREKHKQREIYHQRETIPQFTAKKKIVTGERVVILPAGSWLPGKPPVADRRRKK